MFTHGPHLIIFKNCIKSETSVKLALKCRNSFEKHRSKRFDFERTKSYLKNFRPKAIKAHYKSHLTTREFHVNVFVSPAVTNITSFTSYNIYQYAKETFGKRFEMMAWRDYLGMSPDEYEENKLFMEIFIPWFLYSWEAPDTTRLAIAYVADNLHKITKTEKEFIFSSCNNIYSFYQVLEVGYGHYLKIKDLITNETHFVFEKLGSKQLRPGNIIFSKVGHVKDLSFLLCMASNVIPEYFEDTIEAFARKRKVNRNNEFERMILYYTIIAEVLSPDQGKVIPLMSKR